MPVGPKSLTRIFFALPAVIFACCLAAAVADPSSARACADHAHPSNFDYLVLASMADSPHLLAMARYRSTARQHSASSP